MASRHQVTSERLLAALQAAYASEWLAYYQYWTGAQVLDPARSERVRDELLEHAGQELEHAATLAQMILARGSNPALHPDGWTSRSPCVLTLPLRRDARSILSDNLTAEQCAIRAYERILSSTPITTDLISPSERSRLLAILNQEVEHELDLRRLLKEIG